MPEDVPVYKDTSKSIEARVKDLVSRMTLEEKVSQMVHNAAAIKHLDIPEYDWWNECLHGVARASRATVFPQAVGLGATFDEDLIFRVASAISDEARAMHHAAVKKGNRLKYGGLTFWSPNINIFRDPRWGRGQETYGEDPLLMARLAVQFVKGLQGDHPKYLKVAACAKHFAVHSGPEGDRHHFNAKANKKDMFETYLPAFEALVKAGVEAVMCAYNRTNDEACCASKALIQDILRQMWQFKGHVVSDCWAIKDFHENHKITKNHVESAALALNIGINLNCGNTFPYLTEAVKQGLVKEETLNESLVTLMKTRFKLGMFDPEEANPYASIPADVIGCEKHRVLSREAAQKSIVLLKNKNNILPLSKDIRYIYMVGPGATSAEVLLGNYYGLNDRMVTMAEGVAGKLNPGSFLHYKQGCLLDRKNVNPIDWTTQETPDADVTLAFMGISGALEGEEGESIASATKGDRIHMDLPQNQLDFIKKIRSEHNKPIIVVLTAGSPMDLRELEKVADVILFAWYPGQEGGNAVADVLFGDVSPSGRLPITFPQSLDQLPPYENYSMANRTYRYMQDKPMYPFGYGLSYSKISYENIELSKKIIKSGEEIQVSALISNQGNYKTEEVVQLYISDLQASCPVPRFALKDFTRITLDAKERKKVTFTIMEEMLMLINNDGEKVLEPGGFSVYIAPASPCGRAEELGLSGALSADFNYKV
jgi:beta-glucosidase